MNKRQIHHQLKPVRLVPTWLLLTLAVIFGVVAVIALRQNNLTAIDLRNKVLIADQSNGDTAKALNNLRSFVYAHMNTDLSSDNSVYPPIQLKHRYERLVAKERERVSSENEQIYSDAQAHCEAENPDDFSGRNRVPCIEEYVSSKGIEVQPIPGDLYKFDFASPVWSPDLAGWSLVLAGFFAICTLLRFALGIWIKASHI